MVTLADPLSIALEGDTLSLLEQSDENIARVNELRPFDESVQKKMREFFLPDRVTATLNIEGITATRRQTIAMMDALALQNSVASEEREIANTLIADDFVYEMATQGAKISSQTVREINRILLKDIGQHDGSFRSIPVTISGASFTPPVAHDVPDLVQSVTESLSQAAALHPLILASWLHHQIALIHPFADGNGRTARLLQDYVLIQNGFFPIGVPSSQRDRYYAALQGADEGKWNELVTLTAQTQLGTLARIEAIAKESERRTAWINRLAKVASERKSGTLYKQYSVWKYRMENIRDAFCQASAELDQSSDTIGASERAYEVIDFDDFKAFVSTGRRSGFTWLFSFLFFMDGEPFYKLIAFVGRHRRDATDFSTDLKDVVSLQFTGLPAKSDGKPDFSHFSDEHIRLREVFYHKDKLHAAYSESGVVVYYDDKSIENIIQDLFEDIFLKKGGLSG
jgi:Fic family protein